MSRLVPGSQPVQVVQSSGCVNQPSEDKAYLWKGPEGQNASSHPGCTWHLPKGQGVPPACGLGKPRIWKVSSSSLSVPACQQQQDLSWRPLGRNREGPLARAAHPHHPGAEASQDSCPVALFCGQNSRGGAACSCCFPLWEGHTAGACLQYS